MNKKSQKLKLSKLEIVLTGLLIISILSITVLSYNTYWLWRNHDWQQNEIMLYNSRLNNVRECLKHQDYTCAENKYIDSTTLLEQTANN